MPGRLPEPPPPARRPRRRAAAVRTFRRMATKSPMSTLARSALAGRAGVPSRAGPACRTRPDRALAPGLHPGLRVHQRARRGERLAGLEQRLQPGEDLRPAAVDLPVHALAHLVVGHDELARVADRLDLPGHARGALGLDLVGPQSVETLHEPARRVDLEVLAGRDRAAAGVHALVARAGRPVRLHAHAEVVLLPRLVVGDCLPELLRGRLDVDLEPLLHRLLLRLEVALELRQPGGPWL